MSCCSVSFSLWPLVQLLSLRPNLFRHVYKCFRRCKSSRLLLFWSQQGLCHAVRKEAWKFLLGYFPWNSTHEERKLLQKSKMYACFPQRTDSMCLKLSFVRLNIHKIMCSLNSDEYFRMKLQWKSVSEEQERRNSRLRDYRSLIGMSLITLQVLFFSCFKNVFEIYSHAPFLYLGEAQFVVVKFF